MFISKQDHKWVFINFMDYIKIWNLMICFLKIAHKTRTEKIIFHQRGGGVLSRLSTADRAAAAEKGEEIYTSNFCWK